MLIELKVPSFPESVTDGTVLNWNKRPGEAVKRDESIVDIETDKVVFEVPAPKDGVLEEIVEKEGSVVVSGQLIGRMREGGTAAGVAEPEGTADVAESTTAASAPFATPSARRLIAEHGLDINIVEGSGSGNRILKEDVLKVISSQQHEAVKAQVPEAAEEPVKQISPAPSVNLDVLKSVYP
jgi:2-oxoglutarate dehydrogenase E2 component (dihydrolipoamide succinyltransferase)